MTVRPEPPASAPIPVVDRPDPAAADRADAESIGREVGLLWAALERDGAAPRGTSEHLLRRVLAVRAALERR